MTYRFAGFLSPCRIERPATLPAGAVWREITTPFGGSGVRLSGLIGQAPTVEVIHELARTLGFDSTDTWLYLTYDCWGGQIDFVYGVGLDAGEPFGPVEADARNVVEAAFTSLMAKLNLGAEQAMLFAPFERGFWGEA